VTSHSRLQQFAPTVIQLALPSNCMHKIPYFLCAPALHENCCTIVIMLSSFDKCFVGKNLLLDRKENQNGVQEDIQDT